MNTNQLKKFAQGARLKLLEQVEAKLNFVLTHDTAELRGKAETVRKLKEELTKIGQKALIDKVAYTWFNRLIALRFMDANGYQPLGISIISPSGITNSVSPQILEEIHSGNFPIELKINRNEILDILDGRLNSNNPDNDVYKQLLVASCNQLSSSLPFLFERIDDYTELLLPDDLTSPFSIIRDVIDGMSQEDCSEVEIIGWLYQFYISEKKDEVFASKSAVKKEDIPAATQLFTPRWIVEYMVQNTVGKLWLENKPNSKLRDYMPYFIESESFKSEDYLKVSSVEEIKLLDQASGSGHILVYGFELFYKIYEEEGYNPIEIPELIVKNNLHGFEIDERAAQLSCFAISMKGRSLNRKYLSKQIEPNILCYQDITFTKDELIQVLTTTHLDKSSEFQQDLRLLEQATNLGSLILPHSSESFLKNGLVEIEKALPSADIFRQDQLFRLEKAIKQLLPLSRKYHCIVDNPPYMGSGNMNKTLGDFVKTNYPDSKTDLMTCFMEAGINMLKPKGYLGMVNFSSWVFLSSFERLRQKIIDGVFVSSFLHNGRGIFGPDFGTVTFTIQNEKKPNSFGCYFRLFEKQVEVRTPDKIRTIFLELKGSPYEVNQKLFKTLPGNVFGYWLNEITYDIFRKNKQLKDVGLVRQGASTSDNNRFLRFWFEVCFSKIGFDLTDVNETINSKYKFFPYNKGGDYKKWYGTEDYVINYGNNGYELKEFQSTLNQGWTARLKSREFYFKPSLSWSKIAYDFSCRLFPTGFIFDVAGCSYFPDNDFENELILGYLNSNVSSYFLSILSPTVNFEIEHIKALPKVEFTGIDKRPILNCIDIIKLYDSSKELNWSFSKNNLIQNTEIEIHEQYEYYCKYWEKKLRELTLNEEENNKNFILKYGLEEVLSSETKKNQLTILSEELTNINDKIKFNPNEVFAQFMSYAVGCMFGRYSLDKEGLILANQGENLNDYLIKVEKSLDELLFIPDEDNIIPLLDDEWFEDDIVARFYTFLKAGFGEKNFQKNLAFIEECLEKDIRKYFVTEFYNNHIKRYKKRPIYWLFSSPNGSFSVLIYLHRYTPDTLNKMLNSYLREFIEKLNLQRKQLEHIEVNGTPSEQSKARKEIDKIDLKLADCKQYEAEILYPLASERIALDLDDGVLVNYNKLGAAVATVPGLNDKVAKKKVKEFDWIDKIQIR
jgi:hypothetical protein